MGVVNRYKVKAENIEKLKKYLLKLKQNADTKTKK